MTRLGAGRGGSTRNASAPSGMTEATALIAELKTSNRLLAVIATKGMEQRQAIVLLDSVGFQPTQIAAALGVTANAVSITLYRLRRAERATHESSTITEESEHGAE